MELSRRFKLVSGTVSVAMALGVGAAVAAESSAPEDIQLKDEVAITEVALPAAFDLGAVKLDDANDSFASPFDEGVDNVNVDVDDVDSVDVDSVDSVDVDSVDVDSVDSNDSP